MHRALWLCVIMTLGGCVQTKPRAEKVASVNRSGFADTAFVREACAAPDSVLRGERPCMLLNQGVTRPRRLP